MSTRTDLLTYDEKYFDVLFDHAYKNAPKLVKQWIMENMIPMGDVAIESLLETAIATENNITKFSTVGADFLNEDGSVGGDAKKATAFINPNRPRCEAHIKGFQNKTGDLYICVYEPLLEKFYYFNVPNSFYYNRKTLAIYFELDGTPRKTRMRWDSPENLWKYECPTGIQGLANIRKKKKQMS
jgi:hypothetical protein